MGIVVEEEEIWRNPSWLYPSILIVSAITIYWRSRALSVDKAAPLHATFLPPSFLAFQRIFLTLFFLASGAEALQSVYGEALYHDKGMKREDIAQLLAAGYFSSLCLGTILGILTDFIGPKKSCIAYGLLQLMCSLFKQSSRSSALLIASVLQGLATSLFSCAFETWMTAEHEKLGFWHELLSDTFWIMSLGGAVVSIGSGALANFLVKQQTFGLSGPSVAAAAVAGITVVGIALLWEENSHTFQTTWATVANVFQPLSDKKVILLGLTQACFDFAITVFWFLWTPTLVADGRELQVEMIFPCLMASAILGSIISASLLCGPYCMRPESILRVVLLSAALALAVPAYDYQEIGVLVAVFCIFHICSGIAWPALARLRSMYILNERRAGMITLFRVPFNVAVIAILINGSLHRNMENSSILAISIIGLLSGAYSMHILNQLRLPIHEKSSIERP